MGTSQCIISEGTWYCCVKCDHLVKVLFTRFFHCEVIAFFFVINEYLGRDNSEIKYPVFLQTKPPVLASIYLVSGNYYWYSMCIRILPKETFSFLPDLFIYSVFIYVSNGLMHIYFIHWVIIQHYVTFFCLSFGFGCGNLFWFALLPLSAIHEKNLYYLIEEISFKIFRPPQTSPFFFL